MTEMRILIADDNATLRSIIQTTVEGIGMFEIDAVGTGCDALRLYREKHHELVIIDNVMPNKDGIEVLRELKSDPFIAQTHVMMVTGTITRELALTIRSEYLKIDDLIVKPVDLNKLREKLILVVARFRRKTRGTNPVLRSGAQDDKLNVKRPVLEADIIDRGNIAIIDFKGSLCIANKDVVGALLKKLPAIITNTIIVDINTVEHIDEFGFGTLAIVCGWLKLNGKDTYISWDGCSLRDRLVSLGINQLVHEHSHQADPLRADG